MTHNIINTSFTFSYLSLLFIDFHLFTVPLEHVEYLLFSSSLTDKKSSPKKNILKSSRMDHSVKVSL